MGEIKLDPSVHLLTWYRAFDHCTKQSSSADGAQLSRQHPEEGCSSTRTWSNALKQASYWTLSEGKSQYNRILPSVFQSLTTKLYTSLRVSSLVMYPSISAACFCSSLVLKILKVLPNQAVITMTSPATLFSWTESMQTLDSPRPLMGQHFGSNEGPWHQKTDWSQCELVRSSLTDYISSLSHADFNRRAA